MADSPEQTYLTQKIIEALRGITEEMNARVETTLPEKDVVAISTALAKAGIEGARLSAVDMAAHLIEQGVNVHLGWDPNTLSAADIWAQRYSETVE